MKNEYDELIMKQCMPWTNVFGYMNWVMFVMDAIVILVVLTRIGCHVTTYLLEQVSHFNRLTEIECHIMTYLLKWISRSGTLTEIWCHNPTH